MSALITGATGLLGKYLAKELASEKPFLATRGSVSGTQWRHLDLNLPDTFDGALAGIDTIFHLASATRKFDAATDVLGTKNLLAKAKDGGIRHFIYVSIVGIDRVPMSYYKIKVETERVVQDSGVPYTILRATQFHEFIDMMLTRFLRLPVAFWLKKALFQPVDTGAVARMLAEISRKGPSNHPSHKTLEIGGPEVQNAESLALAWLKARGEKKLLLPLWGGLLGKAGRALCDGGLTTESAVTGTTTWSDWLARKYRRMGQVA